LEREEVKMYIPILFFKTKAEVPLHNRTRRYLNWILVGTEKKNVKKGEELQNALGEEKGSSPINKKSSLKGQTFPRVLNNIQVKKFFGGTSMLGRGVGDKILTGN